MGLDQSVGPRVAADGLRRCRDPGSLGRCAPGRERGRHGGGGELRVERQQHDPLRPKGGHAPRRLIAHRVPVAHGDGDLDLAEIGKRLTQRRRLRLGLFEQRRTPADRAVDLAGLGAAPPRDQTREHPAHRPRRADDGRVPEQIAQKGLDGIQRIRPAQIHENHRHAAHWPFPPGHARTRSQSWATCSGGVWGSTPSPRLNTKGPCPSAFQNAVGRLPQRIAAGQQRHGIEVALHRAMRLQSFRRPG